MFEQDYIDPFDELVALHSRCLLLEERFNEMATSHNFMINKVDTQDQIIKVLLDAIQVLQNSQIYLLEDNDEPTD